MQLGKCETRDAKSTIPRVCKEEGGRKVLPWWGSYSLRHRCPERSMRVMIMAKDEEGGEHEEEEEME